MIRQSLLQWGEDVLQDGLAHQESWADIVQGLTVEGLNRDEVAELLRRHNAWVSDAREMKTEGYPYDEIIFHLTTLRASWAEIGRALMAVGLPPADMLRAVLPSTHSEEHWPVIQVALLEGPEGSDFAEVAGVMEFFFLSAKELLESIDLDPIQRERLVKRLEIEEE